MESTPPPVLYKDRSAGLTIFGILTILKGGIVSLFIPLILFGTAASAKTTGTPSQFPTILPAVLLYGPLAIALVWLGIGSVMARRWARALLLIYSWNWLVMGVIIGGFMAVILPATFANLPAGTADGHAAVSPAVMTGILIGMFVFFGIIWVILPAIWTFFYSSRHVKATCERCDPVTRWTDACPLPVLAVCLWQGFSMLIMLAAPFTSHGVMPFFGIFLTGLPGVLFCVILAAVWGYSAWLMYRMDVRGWWIILVGLCLVIVSNLLTFSHHDISEMYRLMDYPETQIAQIQMSPLFTGNRQAWFMTFSTTPILAYLLFIKKYFTRK